MKIKTRNEKNHKGKCNLMIYDTNYIVLQIYNTKMRRKVVGKYQDIRITCSALKEIFEVNKSSM